MSRRITVSDSGFIKIFGCYGPITVPVNCEDGVIKSLISSGHNVYEVKAGKRKRLTMNDFVDKKAASVVKPVVAPKVVETKVTVEETATVDTGKVFNGVTPTTSATVPEVANEPSPAALTKAQKRAQKKAKLEAQKAVEAEAAIEVTAAEITEVAETTTVETSESTDSE